MKMTRQFILDTWAPEAKRTLKELACVMDFRDVRRSAFLCDHFREGARTVGASTLVDLATSIEFHIADRNFDRAGELVWDAMIKLRAIPQRLRRAA